MKISKLTLMGIILLVALAFFGVASAFQNGCTPGYWKNHPDAWVSTDPNGDIGEIGDLNGDGNEDTFMDALNYKGGSGDIGAQRILVRAGIAGRLNSFAFGSNYPLTSADVEYFKYLKSHPDGNREEMLELAGIYDEWNNAYCPCNNNGCPF